MDPSANKNSEYVVRNFFTLVLLVGITPRAARADKVLKVSSGKGSWNVAFTLGRNLGSERYDTKSLPGSSGENRWRARLSLDNLSPNHQLYVSLFEVETGSMGIVLDIFRIGEEAACR